MTQRRYDRERGRRYKDWWSRQAGPPQGELIEIPKELWSGKSHPPSIPKTGSEAG